MKNLIPLIIISYLFVACEFDTQLDIVPHDPILQVDAVFFSDEPFTEIKVRRSFGITGSNEYTVPANEIWAEGAQLTVYHGNDAIIMVEHQPGRFLPASNDRLIQKGDKIEINVKWENLEANALAVVPDYSTTESIHLEPNPLILQPDYYRVRNPETDEIDSLAHYTAEMMYSQGIIPSMSAIALNSLSEVNIRNEHGESILLGRLGWNMFDFVNFYGDELQGLEQIRFNKVLNFFYDKDNNPVEKDEIIRAIIVIPETIYVDFTQTHSDYFSPVTVTNVNGGTGLFIGAIRDTLLFPFHFSDGIGEMAD